MIGTSSLFVRISRQDANLASGLEIHYEAPDGELGDWQSWDATSVEVLLSAGASKASDPHILVDQVARALQPLLVHSPAMPGADDLLVNVQHPDLTGLNWERLADQVGRKVVRYSRRVAAHAYQPVDLPISVLFANAEGNHDERQATSSRYFRTVQASKQRAGDVQRLIAGGQFDIVHLGVRLTSQDVFGRSDEVLHADGSTVEPRKLKNALRRTRARLLVLEHQDDVSGAPVVPLEALRRLAHRLHRATGVEVIASGPADFGRFYYELTHDQHLTQLVEHVQPRFSDGDQGPALWLRQGGDTVLRLVGASARIAAEVVQEHQRIEAAYEAQLSGAAPMGRPMGKGHEQVATDPTVLALERLSRLRDATYSFDQESNGVEPIAGSRAELLEIQRLRSQAVREPARVVNAWVQAGGRALPATSSLAAGSTYQLLVNIGSPDRRSAAVAPAPIDETAIADAYVDGSAVMTVAVSSTDFTIDRATRPLRLPTPPSDSESVLFTVSAPTQPGSYRLRVGIYHRTNLLQSLMMTIAVTADAQPLHQFGYRAELEWALSSTFRNLDEMEEPALTIVTNEDPHGTHAFVVYGAVEGSAPDILRQVDLPPDVLKTTIDDARADLQNVCATFKNGNLDKYRFDRDNRSNRARLLDDLKVLALAGAGLFVELTTGDDARFNAELESHLRGSKLIQIASVKSSNYVFPWSLVYDHEFRESSSNRLCDVVGRVIDHRGTIVDLRSTPCFADECPYRNDPAVVCPAGFWGFRHRIEQPLLAPPVLDEDDDAATGGTPRHDVVTAIPVDAGSRPRAVMGVSESLADWERHTTRALEQFGGVSERASSIDPLLDGLRRLDLHLAYFYCHGGRRGSKAFLGLGTRREVERLFPQYLKSVSWPGLHPFIFINGCHTVGVSPDDLLTFNKMFARAPASGILGTEIAVPEELAQHVAEIFFDSFPNGIPVGQIVGDIRLDLLLRCNPLGLAYTPYCMAALRLAV